MARTDNDSHDRDWERFITAATDLGFPSRPMFCLCGERMETVDEVSAHFKRSHFDPQPTPLAILPVLFRNLKNS
jgi:hypothetical protein